MERPKTGTNERPGQDLAVVVGAGGMGMAAARRLAQSYRILLVDINGERLAEMEGALRGEGYNSFVLPCDITDPSAVIGLAQHTAGLGPFRVLAHVAGLSPSMADWRTIMRVNLLGALYVEQALQPLAGQGTAAIFISSLAAHFPAPAPQVVALLDNPASESFLDDMEVALDGAVTTQLAYQVSKIGINRLCRQRAGAWGSRGARIVSLSPGLIATPMGALEFERQPAKYDLLATTPLKREGTMSEVADAIEFLASDKASFISGIDLLVDGGVSAALGQAG